MLTLPVGKKLAMSESSSSANAGINVLFAFPEYDEESYSIEAVADNEFRITNNSTKAVLQVRAINSNGVIMTKAQLKENLPELQPYDWNGYSVYEWTEHGNNKKFICIISLNHKIRHGASAMKLYLLWHMIAKLQQITNGAERFSGS